MEYTYEYIQSASGIKRKKVPVKKKDGDTDESIGLLRKSKHYSVVKEFLPANSSTGMLVNDKKDRTLIVLQGKLDFLEDPDSMENIGPGQTKELIKGMSYSLSTNLEDGCSFILVEDSNYEKDLVLKTSRIIKGIAKPATPAERKARKDRRILEKKTAAPLVTSTNGKTSSEREAQREKSRQANMITAAKSKEERAQLVQDMENAKSVPSDSTSAVGVNLLPVTSEE